MKQLNWFENIMLTRILKKVVKQEKHIATMTDFLFELNVEARGEFCKDSNETFKQFIKELYDKQLRYLGD